MRQKRERNIFKCPSGIRALTAVLIFAAAILSPSAYARAEGDRMLVPMGQAVGIQLNTDGVLVVGLVDGENGSRSPAADAGLLPGDLITEFNGQTISCADDFRNAASNLDGSPVPLTANRDGESLQMTIEPRMTEKGTELGLWLRDGITGIGTLTYYDPETGAFGGLGHSISDVDSGRIIPMGRGHIMRSSVTDVIRGIAGCPGELCGTFDEGGICGSISKNTVCGIFGQLSAGVPGAEAAIPVADENEVKLGAATVRSTTSGSDIEEFKIEVVRIYRNGDSNRSMMIKITDPRLLERTGGIVQGMSGSPIIQDGKLIGAVTHVLINDPTSGFAVSIYDMLEACGE